MESRLTQRSRNLLEPANTWKLGRKLCNCTMYHLAGTKKLKLLRADWHSSCYNKGAEAMTQITNMCRANKAALCPHHSKVNKIKTSANIVRAVTMLDVAGSYTS